MREPITLSERSVKGMSVTATILFLFKPGESKSDVVMIIVCVPTQLISMLMEQDKYFTVTVLSSRRELKKRQKCRIYDVLAGSGHLSKVWR